MCNGSAAKYLLLANCSAQTVGCGDKAMIFVRLDSTFRKSATKYHSEKSS